MSAPYTRKGPLVSVNMVIHQPDADYLRTALTSLLCQSIGHFEVVVVEDPSECSGRDVVLAFGDPRIRYFLNQSRTCLIDQRNRALAESQAEFIAILDADDVADPRRLERQLRFLCDHSDVGVVGSQICVIDAEGTPCGFRKFPVTHEEIVGAMTRVVPINQSSVMYRKSLIDSVGGYKQTSHGLAEDYDLWSRLARHGVRFANLPEALVNYRLHSGQMKAQFTRRTLRSVLDVKKRHWARVMGFRALLRMWGERCLLWLPEFLLLRLLLLTHYQGNEPTKRLPTPSTTEGNSTEEHRIDGEWDHCPPPRTTAIRTPEAAS